MNELTKFDGQYNFTKTYENIMNNDIFDENMKKQLRPFILIDVSGSVFTRTKNEMVAVVNKLCSLAKDTVIRDNITDAHLILWSTQSEYIGLLDIRKMDVVNIINKCKVKKGGTRLTPSLEKVHDISNKIIGNNDYNDYKDDDIILPIYIFTDGEIDDSNDGLKKGINAIMGNNNIPFNYQFKISVFENNSNNYYIANCNIGNKLVKAMRENKISQFVKYIVLYNYRYDDINNGFTNLYNVTLPHKYIQFGNRCFHIKNYNIFLETLTKEIDEIKKGINKVNNPKDNTKDLGDDNSEEEDIEDNLEDNLGDANEYYGRLEQVGYYLIKTIRDIEENMKDNKKYNRKSLIDFFCDIIGDDKINQTLKDELIYGIETDTKTFHEYKERRGKVFNNAQFKLYTDLQKAICGNSLINYTSFITDKTVYEIQGSNIDKSTNIGIHEYRNSAVYDTKNKRIVPILPIQSSKHINLKERQSLRQWIRAIYSKKYGIPAGSDLVHYTFLIDNLFVQCSKTLPQSVKKGYNTCAAIMLARCRYGEKIVEYKFLKNGEHPKPICSDVKFQDFFRQCPNYPTIFNNSGNECDPMTLWFMVISVLTDPLTDGIVDGQLRHCNSLYNDDLLVINGKLREYGYVESYYKFDKMNIFNKLTSIYRNKLKYNNSFDIKYEKIILNDKLLVPNYYCYITLCDTEGEGGYMLPFHIISSNKICRPNYVITKDAYDVYVEKGVMKCPLCTTDLNPNTFTSIEPKDIYESKIDKSNNLTNDDIINIIHLQDIKSNNTLIKLDDIDFKVNYADKVICKQHIILGSVMESYSVLGFDTLLQNINDSDATNQTVFNSRIPGFLHNVNWKDNNIVIAGGMCRSVLLSQKIEDIDVFFVGLSEEDIKIKIYDVINEFIKALQIEDPDYRFILMYKPLFSVIELLCIKSNNNIMGDDYAQFSVQDVINAVKMKSTLFSGESEKMVTEKKKDNLEHKQKHKQKHNEENMEKFINNKLIHKIQIIMKTHTNINNIFDNFDIYPSCVAFDGSNTYFTENSVNAYKYMLNLVNKDKASHLLYNNRLRKYYKYGFSPCIEKHNINKSIRKKITKLTTNAIKISTNKFMIANINTFDNNIDEKKIIDYIPITDIIHIGDGNNEDDIDDDDIINTNSKSDNNKPLYVTSSCSTMEGLYKYIVAQKINYCYLFAPIDDNHYDVLDVINKDNMVFLESTIDSSINWYDPSQIEIYN